MSTSVSSKKLTLACVAVAGAALFLAEQSAFAQSGSRTAKPAASSGSGSRTAQVPVAMDGYCAVCVMEMKKWVRGKAEHQMVYDGKTYLFPGEEQKQMFAADPVKYVPALGGDCTVCLANKGKRVPGKVQIAALHKNRLFLFPGEEQKQMFLENPGKYADADLALGGKCSVCRVEMKQDVQGKPEFSTIHQGLRYQFPGEKQQNMFQANSAKYIAQ